MEVGLTERWHTHMREGIDKSKEAGSSVSSESPLSRAGQLSWGTISRGDGREGTTAISNWTPC